MAAISVILPSIVTDTPTLSDVLAAGNVADSNMSLNVGDAPTVVLDNNNNGEGGLIAANNTNGNFAKLYDGGVIIGTANTSLTLLPRIDGVDGDYVVFLQKKNQTLAALDDIAAANTLQQVTDNGAQTTTAVIFQGGVEIQGNQLDLTDNIANVGWHIYINGTLTDDHNITLADQGGVLTPVLDSGWQDITLGTGWATSGTYTPQYRIINNVCYLRGVAVASTGAVTSIGTGLPFTLSVPFQKYITDVNTVGSVSGICTIGTAGGLGVCQWVVTAVAGQKFHFGNMSPYLLD